MSEHKALTGVHVKDADQGIVQAVFSTFNVIDSDGDVTVPGAFEDGAPVRISAYGHGSWGGMLPVGKGVIRAGEDEAVLDGQFFLNTTTGRDTFNTVKEMGDLQEWSYGFDVLESDDGEHDDQKVRFLRKLRAHEVSPVLLGAGVATRTLAAKAANPGFYVFDGNTVTSTATGLYVAQKSEPDPVLAYADEGDRALAHAADFVERSRELATLRAKEGRVLSAANRERLTALVGALGDAGDALAAFLAEHDPDKGRNDLIREYARFERFRSGI